MKRAILLLAVLGTLLTTASVASASTTIDLRGTWSCCGAGGAASQTWTITTMNKSTGAFSGDGSGGSFTWPVTGTATGDQVTLTTGPYNELKSYTAVFTGTLSADGKTLSGSWDDDPSPTPDGTFTATRSTLPGNTPKPSDSPVGDVYVADSGGSTLYRVDASTGAKQVVHSGVPFSSIRGIDFGPDGDLYIADFGASGVHRLDLETGTVTRVSQGSTFLLRPWDVAFSLLWPQDMIVTDSQLKTVVRVNRETGKVVRLVDAATPGFGLELPHGIAATPFGDPFVADVDTHKIHRIELLQGKWAATVQKKGFLSAPQDLAIGVGMSDGKPVPRFFASDSGAATGGGVYSWLERDPELLPRGSGTPKLVTSSDLVKTPTGIALSNDGATLYVVSAANRSLVAVDVRTGQARVLADGFASPVGVAVAPPKTPAVKLGTGNSATSATPSGTTTTVTAPTQAVGVTVTVTVSGLLAASATRSVRVKPVERIVPAGRKVKIKLPFKRSLAAQIRAALDAGRTVTAKLTITARAANGAKSTHVKRVRIRA